MSAAEQLNNRESDHLGLAEALLKRVRLYDRYAVGDEIVPPECCIRAETVLWYGEPRAVLMLSFPTARGPREHGFYYDPDCKILTIFDQDGVAAVGKSYSLELTAEQQALVKNLVAENIAL